MGRLKIMPNANYSYTSEKTWFKRWSEFCGEQVSVQRFLILLVVAEAGGEIEQGKIEGDLGIERTTLSRSLRSLMDTVVVLDGKRKTGLVDSYVSPENRRKRCVCLTPTGVELLRRLYE
jgi:DNA-binding MarR family transcriptional regulator